MNTGHLLRKNRNFNWKPTLQKKEQDSLILGDT